MAETTALTTAEAADLDRHERIIARSISSFFEVGEALVDIRDRRLWRGAYESFEDYCDRRWHFTTRRARQLIAGAKVVKNLAGASAKAENGTTVPLLNERSAREVAKAPEEKQAEVVARAAAKANGKAPTAKQVREAVEEVKREEAPAAKVITDKAGAPVPQHLLPAFTDKRFAEAMNLLTEAKSVLQQIANDPAVGSFLHWQQVEADYKNLWRTVKFAKPYAVHQKCRGKGCKDCRHTGWLPKMLHDAAAKEVA